MNTKSYALMLTVILGGIAILKIFAESTKVILYCMESDVDKTETVKRNLIETVGRLQDVLENTEC